MSLVAGCGPLSRDRAGQLTPPIADDVVYIEPHPRRVQAIRDGRTAIGAERALMVHRRGRPLSYAFAADEIGDLPGEPVAEAPGFVVVPWTAADSWFEEGRRLVQYPPNPYHRVDCRPTTRGLRVDVAGTMVVDTVRTVILFETTYWDVVVGYTVTADVAWSYEEPLPESLPIKGMLSFDDSKVDVLAELPESASYSDCGCQVPEL